MKHGFLLVDKPDGPTSHDVVDVVRRTLSERKIGHLGTLDPAATGLLVLAVGAKALKVVEFFKDLPKEYEAEIKLGAISSTYDKEGVIEEPGLKAGWTPPDEMGIRRIIDDHFVGQIEQVPPEHSAIKISGERAYRKARQGKPVDMPSRQVRIAECEILEYEFPRLVLRVACSSGTYIRSLAHDLGDRLRCGGYLSGLRRTKVGEWSVDFAGEPEAAGWAQVIPLKEVLQNFGGIEITDAEAEDLRHGRDIEREVKDNTIAWHQELPMAILEPRKDGSRLAHARKVL